MPTLFKQLVKLLLETAFHTFLNMIIAGRMDMTGVGSFFSKTETSLQVASEQYLWLLEHKLQLVLRKKWPHSGLFWSVFSPNAGKYGPE